MKNALALILLCIPAVAVAADPPKGDKKITLAEFKIFDPIPDEAYFMSRTEYIKFVKDLNESSYRQNRINVEEALKATPNVTSATDTENSTATTIVSGGRNNISQSWDTWAARTYYTTARNTRYFERTRWGGGPLVILNPFAKRPPKVILHDGVKYLLDPDKVIKTQEAAEAFLKAY